jgi:hypothetical protein
MLAADPICTESPGATGVVTTFLEVGLWPPNNTKSVNFNCCAFKAGIKQTIKSRILEILMAVDLRITTSNKKVLDGAKIALKMIFGC